MRKRTMGKRTGAILLGGVLLALTLAGCGGGRETETAAEAEAEIMEDTAAQAAEEETEAPVPDQAAEDAEDAENAEAQETEAEAEEMQLTDEYLIEAAKEAGIADPSDSAAVARLRAFHGSINIDQISDLGQLQCFKGLAELEAHASTTYDIEWVGYLPQLKYLELEYNSLKDLSPLAGLEDLEVLEIEAYGIEDLEPLASLAQLKVLQVVSETVADVSAVGRIASLQYIWLDCRHLASLECDWGALENLNYMELYMPEAADYSSVLNVRFDAPTYERTGELEKMLGFLGMDGFVQANRYRGEYDNEEVPDNVCFKCVFLRGDDARDKIDAAAAARYNYDFLQKVDFHLDSYYQCIQYSEQENEAYRSAYEELIAANGDPLKPAPTVDADVHNSSSWENPALFCDGVLYGFDIPIKDMLTDADGYAYAYRMGGDRVPKAKMEEILDNSVVRGKDGEDIGIYKNDTRIGSIRVRNSAEDTRYLGECEVCVLWLDNNEEIEVELPQGNEHAILVTLNRFTEASLPDIDWHKAKSGDFLSFDVGDVEVVFYDYSSDSGFMSADSVRIEKKND